MIDAIFIPFEAQQIKAIHLSSFTQKDFLFWPLDRHGEYIVKSSYKILCEKYRRDDALSSNRETTLERNMKDVHPKKN